MAAGSLAAGLAMVFHLMVADRHRTLTDVDGEAVVVPSE